MNRISWIAIVVIIVLLYFPSLGLAQNNAVFWSSFNMGFAAPASSTTVVKSIVGQTFIGLIEIDNKRIEGGFLALASNVGIVGVDELLLSELPMTYNLKQNYPNPFNPETVIEYSLPKASEVLIGIFNLRGEEVIRILDKHQPAGIHRVTWNASNVASGIYFYKLQAGDYVESRKMLAAFIGTLRSAD